MNFSDDEETSSSPPGYRRTRSHSRLTRRKLLDDEYSDTINQIKQETEQSKNSLSLQDLIDVECNSNVSIKDIIEKIALLAPDISDHLCKILDNVDKPATTTNIQKLINTIKDLKVNITSQKNIRKSRHLKQIPSKDYNKINQVIALFKDFHINEDKDNIDSMNKKDVISEFHKESISSIETETLSCQKQNRIDEENIEKLEKNNLDNLRTCTSENTRLRITRKSTKNSVPNKESYTVKVRKSKETL